MATLLKWVGGIWAAIGAGNIILMPWTEGSEGVLTFGLIFNGLLFIIPGLLVYGTGARMASKPPVQGGTTENSSTQDSHSVEARLEKLEELKDKGLINDEEYAARRQRILEDV